MVICLEHSADLHMAQLMPLPLTVSCFSKIQIGFAFLVPAHRVILDKGPLNGCVCVCVYLYSPRVKQNKINCWKSRAARAPCSAPQLATPLHTSTWYIASKAPNALVMRNTHARRTQEGASHATKCLYPTNRALRIWGTIYKTSYDSPSCDFVYDISRTHTLCLKKNKTPNSCP